MTLQRAEHAAALIQIAGLSKRYGTQRVLSDVSFDVLPGEVLGLIGPNGAGKTTLLEALAGILPVGGGEILWRDVALTQGRRRDALFYLPDGVRPWADQYVIHIIELFAGVYGCTPTRVAETIQAVGLLPTLAQR